jgi:hypothetical protein
MPFAVVKFSQRVIRGGFSAAEEEEEVKRESVITEVQGKRPGASTEVQGKRQKAKCKRQK